MSCYNSFSQLYSNFFYITYIISNSSHRTRTTQKNRRLSFHSIIGLGTQVCLIIHYPLPDSLYQSFFCETVKVLHVLANDYVV